MKKMFTWMVLAMFAVCSTAVAQEDITVQYIANSSFEADAATSLSPVENSADGLRGYTLNQPSGWTISGTDVTKLLVTANTFKPKHTQNLGLFPKKAWTNQNYNKFIHKALQLSIPKKVWTALSTA